MDGVRAAARGDAIRAECGLYAPEAVLLEQADDGSARPLAVVAMMRNGGLHISASDRVRDGPVLLIGQFEVGPQAARRHAGSVPLVPHHVRHRFEPAVAAEIDERAMKPFDGVYPAVRVVLLDGHLHLADRLIERGERGVVWPRADQALDGRELEGGQDLVDLPQFSEGQRHDAHAVPRDDLNELSVLETDQRLSNRRATHAEFGGKLVLEDLMSGRVLVVQDAPADFPVRSIDQRFLYAFGRSHTSRQRGPSSDTALSAGGPS